MATITCSQVAKSYGHVSVIEGFDLEIREGQFVVLLGPSGCGKSTMLRMIAGLEEISGGEISIDGKVVNGLPPGARGVAMVFQSYALYPHMTVYDNIAFGLRRQKVPEAAIRERIARVSGLLGLDDFMDRRPRKLSGGQQQRVAMARAIIKTPKVFLFDEPLSNLDAKLREKLRTEIRKIHLELRTTTIFVTHDQLEAMTIADEIVLMNGGEIEQKGTPSEIFNRPATRFAAHFIGSPTMNFRDGRVRISGDSVTVNFGSASLELPASDFPDLEDQQEVEIGLRPANLDIATAGAPNAIEGRISLIENMGAEAQVIADVDGEELSVVTQAFADLDPGAPVTFSIDPSQVHLFSKTDGRSLRRAEA